MLSGAMLAIDNVSLMRFILKIFLILAEINYKKSLASASPWLVLKQIKQRPINVKLI